MGLSPEEWQRALALSGAGPETLGLFNGLDDETIRLAREEAARRERAETQRALDQLGGGQQIPQMDVGPVEVAPQRQGFTDEEVLAHLAAQGIPSDAERAAQERELRTTYLPETTITAGTASAGQQRDLPPRAAEALAAYQALPPADVASGRTRVRPEAPEAEGELGTAPAPRFDVPTPAINQALGRTGSEYRLPESTASAGGMPDAIALMQEEARIAREKHENQAASYDRQGAIEGLKGARGLGSVAKSRQDVEGRRAQQRGFEAAAMDRLNRLTALVDSPPQETSNAGRRIMGAILNFASRGQVSDGRAEMAREMAANVERWKAEIAGNKQAMESLLNMSKHQGSAAEFDAKLDHALLEHEFGALNQYLEQEKLGAKSADERNAAEQAQLTLVKGFKRNLAYSMPLDRLAGLAQAGELDEEGTKIFQERAEGELKLQKGDLDLRKGQQDLRKGEQDLAKGPLEMESLQAEIESKRADTTKKQREAAGSAPGTRVAGGFEIADPGLWGNLEGSTKAEFEKGASKVPSLVANMRELRKQISEHGTESTWTEAGAGMATLSAGILGEYKEAARLGALDNGVAVMVEKLIGDANSMTPESLANVGPRLDQAIKQTQADLVRNAAGLGLRPMQLKPDQPAPAPTSPDRGVVIRTPDGRRMRIPERSLDKALELGAQVIGG